MPLPNTGLAEDIPVAEEAPKEDCIDLPPHEGLSDYDAQIAAREDPEFDKAGKVHDWRNHVGEQCQRKWPTFSLDVRLAIATDAQVMAEAEEWE